MFILEIVLEKDLEYKLIRHIEDFLLELGKGFAFIGNQYKTIFTKELLTSVADAKAGDAKEVDATVWHSFSGNVLNELLSKEGVSYTFYYNYGGECFYITIPAGAVLEEGCEWYGPLKLNAMFGRTIIDKSELHAALNK